MYQAPYDDRTDAWKPSGLMSAWIVAVRSVIPRPRYALISGCLRARPGAMIAYSWSANWWKLPFGAGREMTRGFVRAAVVRSRGARASTDRSRLVLSWTARTRFACTPTLRPAARGFAAFAQRCFVPSVSFSARRCFSVPLGAALCAGTAAADTATARTMPSASPAVAKLPRRPMRRGWVRVMTLSPLRLRPLPPILPYRFGDR